MSRDKLLEWCLSVTLLKCISLCFEPSSASKKKGYVSDLYNECRQSIVLSMVLHSLILCRLTIGSRQRSTAGPPSIIIRVSSLDADPLSHSTCQK